MVALNAGILIVPKLELRIPELIIPSFDPEHHVYQLDGKVLPGVTSVLQAVGIIDIRWFTAQRREEGHAIHLACQLYDEGDLDPESVDPAIQPYLEAHIAYRRDIGQIPDILEWPLANTALGYCGTPDGVTFGKALEDIKSGAYEPWHRVQAAAYAYLLPEPMSVERRAVYLHGDGRYSTRTFPKAELWGDFNTFQSALNIYNWKARNK